MYAERIAASTYVQISREELENWLDHIGFRGKWSRDPRFAGIYLLELSDGAAIKLSSTIGSKDDAMGRGQASMQLALVSRKNGRVLNKKAQGQSHFARTKGWIKNWANGIDTMKRAYQSASDFYDVLAEIGDRQKYQQDMLKMIEDIPGWSSINFFVSLHHKVERGGVIMPNEVKEIQQGLATSAARPDPQKTPPTSSDEPTTVIQERQQAQMFADKQLQAIRGLWLRVSREAAPDERSEKNKQWVLNFTQSIGNQLKAGRHMSPAQITTVVRNLDQWKIQVDGKPASNLFQ